jgi:hypothetical protein
LLVLRLLCIIQASRHPSDAGKHRIDRPPVEEALPETSLRFQIKRECSKGNQPDALFKAVTLQICLSYQKILASSRYADIDPAGTLEPWQDEYSALQGKEMHSAPQSHPENTSGSIQACRHAIHQLEIYHDPAGTRLSSLAEEVEVRGECISHLD